MLKIWGRPNSICTQRVLWACVEANVEFDLTFASATMGPDGHVSAGATPYGIVDTPWYEAMNPNRTVPTVDDDGFVLWESNAIVGYVAAKYGPMALFGDDPETFARASQWMAWTNEHLEPPLHVLVMELVRLPEDRRSAANVDSAARGISPWLELLDRHLSERAYVTGERFTMGDIPTGAAAYRWKLFGVDGPETPHIDGWLARLAARKGFRQHVEPRSSHL
jgi:glutathione S-transferase